MMQLPLDREKRLLLLKWLKNGYIDTPELDSLAAEAEDEMTIEEIDAEIARLSQIEILEEQNKDLPLAL